MKSHINQGSLRMLRQTITHGLAGAFIFATFAMGCALTAKSEPLLPRYFSPERADGKEKPVSSAEKTGAELRLGHVGAVSYLDERMVYRDSAFELGYYEERRWTEAPEEYLRRGLERALFEQRGLRHVVGGSAPTLEVELLVFDEIRKPKALARVQVRVRLQDVRLVRWEETLTADEPIKEADGEEAIDATVRALGTALTSVVDRAADRVAKELTPPTPPANEEKK